MSKCAACTNCGIKFVIFVNVKLLIKIAFVLPFLMAFTETAEKKETIEWLDFNTGFQTSLNEGKIAVIDCYTDWCGWCKKMDKTTFSDSAVVARMNDNFIAIKFNPEKPGRYFTGADSVSGRELLYALSNNKPSGYPTLFFFVPQFNKMFQVPGYQDVAKFTETLDQLEKYQDRVKQQ